MNEIKEGYKEKLKGKLFGLLKERENAGEWEKYLDSIEIEIMGAEKEIECINYYILKAKVASLRYLNYKYFRKTIFECMNLIDNVYTIEDIYE